MGAFIILFRETFEASLVLGLVFAFLDRTGRRAQHRAAVWQGTASAVVVSVAIGAMLFVSVGELDGRAEHLYEATAMVVASGVLSWMVFWMRRQARTIGGALRTRVDEAIASGGGLALALVAFVATVREGIESVLFLFASVRDDGPLQTIASGAAGAAAAIALGVAFHRGSLRLDVRRFFQVTGVLVIVFAAYLLLGAVHELGEASGGELTELAGPPVAATFAGVCMSLYLRRPPMPAAPPAVAQSAG